MLFADNAASDAPRTSPSAVGTRLILTALLSCLGCEGRDHTNVPDAQSLPVTGSVAPDARPEGPGTISAVAEGKSFGLVASSFVIQGPDTEGTTVIYLFSNSVRCLDLSFAGWDSAISNGTMVLKMAVSGSSPGSYRVVGTPSHSPGEATVEVWRPSPRRPMSELQASGGWVTLDATGPGAPAIGTFAVTFGMSQWTGRFNAEFCSGGHEP